MTEQKTPEQVQTRRERGAKHKLIKDALREAIISGEFKTGEPIPSQNELKQRFGVCHNTVREAIASLVHEGLLSRKQGRRTFVTQKRVPCAVIGVVLPHLHLANPVDGSLSYEVIAPLLTGIENESRERGGVLVLRLDNDDLETEKRNLEDLMAQGVDGIIAFALHEKKNLAAYEKVINSGMPLVLIDRYMPRLNTHYVVSNNYQGAYDAVAKLQELGYDRLVYITYPPACSTDTDRLMGVHNAVRILRLNSVTVTISKYPQGEVPGGASGIIEEWLPQKQTSTAFFAINSDVLLGAYEAILQAGWDPRKAAFACFDDLPKNIQRAGATVRVVQPLDKIGRESVRIIMEGPSEPDTFEHLVLPTTLDVMVNNNLP